MDLVARFGLRSSTTHNKTIYRALWFAVFIHAIAWFYWHPIQRVSSPELPDWVNVRLVAGFEEQEEQQVKPVSKPAPKQVKPKSANRIPAKHNQVNAESEPSDEEVVEVSEPAPASAFVQADSKPFAVENPKPVYPSSARRRGMQGVVLLQVSVSNTGTVTGVHVMRSSGFRVLDVAAMNGVKQWQFIPALQGEKKVSSTVEVPIRFLLDG